MSEYFFGLGNGKVLQHERDRIERAIVRADLDGVGLVCINDPGPGWRYWFTGPNRGEPFDRRLAADVLAAVGKVKSV